MKTAILFDLDGTLLDTLEDLADSVNETLRHFGYPQRTFGEVRAFVGNGMDRLIQQALPDGATEAQVLEALTWMRQYYMTHSQIKTCPYPGVLEALTQLQAEFPVAVVSNKPDVAVKPLCKTYFGDVFALGESAACPRKPAPDMVYAAMKAIGAERCIYVGDSEVDVLTAKNAGVPCLSVLWGFRDKDCLLEAGATHFCENTAELVNCLKAMVK